jgi:aminoglycoside phosphotransferase (APT) family kinase protein
MVRVHADETEVDEKLVRRLLISQFSEWSDLPLEHASTVGTDNAIYRLGNRMGIRLPKIHWAEHQVDKEYELLPWIGLSLSIDVPKPLARGVPEFGYPYSWLVYEWLPGSDLEKNYPGDWVGLADQIAGFLSELAAVDPAAGPRFTRSLAGDDQATRRAISEIEGEFDAAELTALWDDALEAERRSIETPLHVWLHGDLLPGNILVEGGSVTGIIDWSATGVGDPARDLMITWVLPPDAREAFRAKIDRDETTWLRARGWVIDQCAQYIPYYRDTIPLAVEGARRRLQAVVDESNGGRS